jgi:hypothetical protein
MYSECRYQQYTFLSLTAVPTGLLLSGPLSIIEDLLTNTPGLLLQPSREQLINFQ